MKTKTFIALIAALTLLASCGTSPKTGGTDELDAKIREASDYLNTRIPEGKKIAIISVQSESAALSEYIIDELISNAVNDNRYSVVDRQQLDAARSELNFNMSGEVSDQSAQAVGQFTGAQTIVTGRISKIGDSFRFSIRALEVESVQVQGSQNFTIAAGATINALIAQGGGGISTGGTATGARTASGTPGGTTQASAQTASPARPANGTYFFYPRIQGTERGTNVDMYIDRIVVNGQYFTIYITGSPLGKGNSPAGGNSWRHIDHYILLQDLDTPRLTWKPVNNGDDNETGGTFITFQGITAKRFKLINGYGAGEFEEIIMPDQPDQ
jgi:TolB-like protein